MYKKPYLLLTMSMGLLLFAPLVFGEKTPVPTNLIRVVDGKKNYGVPGLTHPIVDGRLDDHCWEKASRITAFHAIDGRYGNTQETEVFLLYSDQEAWHGKGAWRLHLGFKCYNSQMERLRRIGGYYRDAFYPDREAINKIRSRPLAFFIVEGKEVFPHWEYFSLPYDDHWVQERATFVGEILGREPSVGDSITLQLNRRNGIGNENSEWKGTLVFVEATDPVCRILDFGDLTMGSNSAELEVLNNSSQPRTVLATVRIYPLKDVVYDYRLYRFVTLESLDLAGDPYSFSTQIELQESKEKKTAASYQIKEEGEHYITVELSCPESDTVYLRTGFLFTVAANREKLSELKTQLEMLDEEPEPPGSREADELLRMELSEIKKDLQRLIGEANREQQPGSWTNLTNGVDQLEKRIGKLGHRMGTFRVYGLRSDHGTELEYGLGVESNLVKLRRNKPFTGEITDQVKISACGHEYEGFQLVVLPFKKDLRDIRITVSDLSNSEMNASIGSSNVEVSAVGYVHTKLPTYEHEYIGWWADPLVPPVEPYFKGIKAEQLLQPFWITVYVPKGTPAGSYRGVVTIAPANSHPLKMNLLLQVRDFHISVTPHINEFFRFNRGSWESFYDRQMTPEEYRAACNFHLKYRIGQPNAGSDFITFSEAQGSYDYSLVDQNIRFCLERGLNVFDISFANVRVLTSEGLDKALDVLAVYADHLKEEGLFKYALVEPLNEVSAEVTKPFYTMMKDRIPGLRILQKGGGSNFYNSWKEGKKAPLEGVLDIWCPGYVPPPEWDQAIAERHAAGEQCWAYHDYIDCVIDRPAVNLREIHWRAWARKLDGLAYWSTDFWPYNVKKEETLDKKWPHVPWETMSHPMGNGDGHFAYPGPGGKLLSSVRLEVLRDAQEDYEYLYTLRELTERLKQRKSAQYGAVIAEAEKLLDVDNSLPESAGPEDIRKLRERIGDQIEIVKALL